MLFSYQVFLGFEIFILVYLGSDAYRQTVKWGFGCQEASKGIGAFVVPHSPVTD